MKNNLNSIFEIWVDTKACDIENNIKKEYKEKDFLKLQHILISTKNWDEKELSFMLTINIVSHKQIKTILENKNDEINILSEALNEDLNQYYTDSAIQKY